MSFSKNYRILRGPLVVGDEYDQPRIDHIETKYANLKDPAIIRALIDADMQRLNTPPPWASRLIEKLENIKIIAANGGNVEEAIEEAKGFNFGDGDFFGDDNDRD